LPKFIAQQVDAQLRALKQLREFRFRHQQALIPPQGFSDLSI
jgi:hypothetical protein